MTDFFLLKETHLFHRYRRVILSFLFTAGTLFGIFVAAHANNDLLSALLLVSAHKTSLPALLIVSTAPLFAACLAVFANCEWLLHIICSVKAFTWSFCSYLILQAYDSAGWLVHLLLFFSGSCSLVLVYWFSMHSISYSKISLLRNWVITVLLACIFCCFDYCFLSPLLVNLITY